ncbi:unnamed protein product, partial [Phaeothamnion confervicola]
VYFKFQSSVTPSMAHLLQAFPGTPWVFVYRDPVPVVASLLGQGRVGLDGTPRAKKSGKPNSPCLRTRSDPDAEVLAVLGKGASAARHAGDEEYCAARLATLLDHAITQQTASGGLGLTVAYETLPQAVPLLLRHHFKAPLTPLEEYRSLLIGQQYSKGRNADMQGEFGGDTEAKVAAATKDVVKYSEKFMAGRYAALKAASLPAEQLGAVSLEAAAAAAGVARADGSGRGIDGTGLAAGAAAAAKPVAAGPPSTGPEWLRGLERVVDPEAPSWLSSAVYSAPMEPFECPDVPAADYPKEFPILNVVANWNPDNASYIPPKHYLSVCRFDYALELAKALRYRDAEKPFVLYNVPAVDEAARKWAKPGYLSSQLGKTKYRTEHSVNNHFMYYTNKAKQKKAVNLEEWTPPTESTPMTYDEWLDKALADGDGTHGAQEEHWYFRVSDTDSKMVLRDISVFGPKSSPDVFLKEPQNQRGVHCRFGMHGVIAEAHYDGSRNMVAMISGKRRWVLSHPRNCDAMYLLPLGHPSGRHSEVNWADPDLERFPDFHKLRVNEVLLRAGEVLFVPTSWIHYIVNLGVNAQCNSRSGRSADYAGDLAKCGFTNGGDRKSRQRA